MTSATNDNCSQRVGQHAAVARHMNTAINRHMRHTRTYTWVDDAAAYKNRWAEASYIHIASKYKQVGQIVEDGCVPESKKALDLSYVHRCVYICVNVCSMSCAHKCVYMCKT